MKWYGDELEVNIKAPAINNGAARVNADEEEKKIEDNNHRPECNHKCTHNNSAPLNFINSLPSIDHASEDNGDDLCAICYTSELREEPCVKLSCGHTFHSNCVLQLLQHRWNTLKISFAFMACPTCKQQITHTSCPQINAELAKLSELRDNLEEMALEVAHNQGLHLSERLTTAGDPYEGDLKGLALHSCAFYECHDCKKPYFGGMIDCQQQLGQEENTKKENLRCKDCQLKAYGAGQSICEKHGKAHIDWKCNYCCSVALYHCFGTTYFCKRCHDQRYPRNLVIENCNGHDCPLGVHHPPADFDVSKSTFPLGCGLCRSEKLAEMRENKNLIQEVSLEDMRNQIKKQREEEEKREREEAEKKRLEAERVRAEQER